MPSHRATGTSGVVLALAVTASLGTTVSVVSGAKNFVGNKPTPFALTQQDHEISSLVEQQSDLQPWPEKQYECVANPETEGCVWNRTACLWNIDDRVLWHGYGRLDGSATVGDCLYADWAHHMIGITIEAGVPDLVITVTFQPQNTSWSFTPVLIPGSGGTKDSWHYQGCVVGPYYSGRPDFPGSLPEVPDSNGGHALLTTFSVSISGNSGKSNVGGRITYRSADSLNRATYCRGTVTSGFGAGGAVWQTGL